MAMSAHHRQMYNTRVRVALDIYIMHARVHFTFYMLLSKGANASVDKFQLAYG